MSAFARALGLGCWFSARLLAQDPEWIWANATPKDDESCVLARHFDLEDGARSATLLVACDNHGEVWLNGTRMGRAAEWTEPVKLDVTRAARRGVNLLAVHAGNKGSIAAVCLRLDIVLDSGTRQTVVSDSSWRASAPADLATVSSITGWEPVHSFGLVTRLGLPWHNVFAARHATPAESLTLLPGFAAELLCSAQAGEGSWVSLAFDPDGHVVVSPQAGALQRIKLNANGATVEPLGTDLGFAHGLAFVGRTLLANVNRSRGGGLWKIENGGLAAPTLLLPLRGDGEHGPHAVLPWRDALWLVNGNYTALPQPLAANSPLLHYGEDLLLPRLWDPRGHAVDKESPGCVVLRTDLAGKERTLFAGGMRNAYDLAVNEAGEMFSYDSDMEWDFGLPWYRPTRIVHIVSGGEYGWRSGSEVWPAHYFDSLPPALDLGAGSPTGMVFGTGAAFPPRYRAALLVGDWAYGRILAVHLTPRGATYQGTAEVLAQGKPLNVTDLTVGPDGALYFTTGGRGTQSGLYRLRWAGDAPAEGAVPVGDDAKTRAARALRHDLERWHGRRDPAAVEAAWPHLGHPDRWIRYAARVAVEHQPLAAWQERALAESEPTAARHALLALARLAPAALQGRLLDRLGQLEGEHDPATLLEILRIQAVCLARMGSGDHAALQRLRARLDALFPASSYAVNRELARLLVKLDADVVARAMNLLEASSSDSERIDYAFTLRVAKHGWTDALRQRYFAWLGSAMLSQGGESYRGYLDAIAADALELVEEDQRPRFRALLRASAASDSPAPKVSVVSDWRLDDLLPALAELDRGRSWASGKTAYTRAQCAACHRLGSEGGGGGIGPDLTGVAGRLSRRDLLEAILLPSKTISDQYGVELVTLRNGDVVVGRAAGERDGQLWLLVGLQGNERTAIPQAEIVKRERSPASPMPAGLLNVLARSEVLDLLAYLESGGAADAAAFRK